MTNPPHVLVLMLAFALAGCATHGGTRPVAAASALDWRPPDRYEFTLDSSCGFRAFVGKFEVVVADGEVVEADGIDQNARQFLRDQSVDDVRTLSELLQQAADAESDGADIVEVRTGEDGHPTEITLDWSTEADDDEVCYQVTDYAPRS